MIVRRHQLALVFAVERANDDAIQLDISLVKDRLSRPELRKPQSSSITFKR